MMKIDEGLGLIKECVELLEKALVVFDDKIGQPEFIRNWKGEVSVSKAER